MSEHDRDTAKQFSRQAEAYAASPTHARGEDLDMVLDLAAPGPADLCLDLATGPGHTAFRVAARAGQVGLRLDLKLSPLSLFLCALMVIDTAAFASPMELMNPSSRTRPRSIASALPIS